MSSHVPQCPLEGHILRYRRLNEPCNRHATIVLPVTTSQPDPQSPPWQENKLCRSSKPRTTGIPGASGRAYGLTIHSVNSSVVARPQYVPHPLEVYVYACTQHQRDAFFVAGGANEGFDVPMWMECTYSTCTIHCHPGM